VYKDQKLSKNLNGSSWVQISLETRSETLIFCCENNSGTKHELVEVRSAFQLLWNLSSGSGTQSRIQRFTRIELRMGL